MPPAASRGTGRLRGQAAVAGIGASEYARYGRSSETEFAMVCRAVLAAADDAGLAVDDIDGFTGYSNDRSDPVRLATALGVRELRLGAAQAGGGGGGSAGHVAIAAAAVASGLAECVVAYRGCRQGEVGRFGRGVGYGGAGINAHVSGNDIGGALLGPYGVFAAPHRYALKAQRMLHDYGGGRAAMRAVARAAYHHGNANPAAVMRHRTLSDAQYDESRWVAEPYHLYDCCQESDAAAAVIVTTAERARDLRQSPAYILAAGQSSEYRAGAAAENAPLYATSGLATLLGRLYADAGYSVREMDSFQVYDNFTAGVVMALVEAGVCDWPEADDVLTFENLLAPGGVAPLNTSGGNFAEAYILGMGHHLEAVRQLRGSSPNQVPGASLSLVTGGPMTTLTSAVIYGTEATL
jgi:acetyl-CoA acetyltransferase